MLALLECCEDHECCEDDEWYELEDDDELELIELDGIELIDDSFKIDDSHCSQSYSIIHASADEHRCSDSVSWKRISSSMAFKTIHSPEA